MADRNPRTNRSSPLAANPLSNPTRRSALHGIWFVAFFGLPTDGKADVNVGYLFRGRHPAGRRTPWPDTGVGIDGAAGGVQAPSADIGRHGRHGAFSINQKDAEKLAAIGGGQPVPRRDRGRRRGRPQSSGAADLDVGSVGRVDGRRRDSFSVAVAATRSIAVRVMMSRCGRGDSTWSSAVRLSRQHPVGLGSDTLYGDEGDDTIDGGENPRPRSSAGRGPATAPPAAAISGHALLSARRRPCWRGEAGKRPCSTGGVGQATCSSAAEETTTLCMAGAERSTKSNGGAGDDTIYVGDLTAATCCFRRRTATKRSSAANGEDFIFWRRG